MESLNTGNLEMTKIIQSQDHRNISIDEPSKDNTQFPCSQDYCYRLFTLEISAIMVITLTTTCKWHYRENSPAPLAIMQAFCDTVKRLKWNEIQ